MGRVLFHYHHLYNRPIIASVYLMYTDIREFEKVLRTIGYRDITIVLYIIDNRRQIEMNGNCIYISNVRYVCFKV